MKAREELVIRLAEKRRAALGSMSDGAFDELKRAVQDAPESFIDTPADQAFYLVCKAIERFDEDSRNDDALDDVAYLRARQLRHMRMGSDCEQILAVDPACTDARLLKAIAENDNAEVLLGILLDMEDELAVGEDAWTDVLLRPQLRVRAAVVRTCVETARYGMAIAKAAESFALSPLDALGCRHSAALAHARLEDETGFEELDARFDHASSAWSLLARAILNFKLGRMGAARRALTGYSTLVEGGAYALLRPVLVGTYMPDRPACAPCSFAEALLAVHEADPIVVDVPDFALWAESQHRVRISAISYAQLHGLEW